jgi:hypothetical protein
MRIGRNKDQRRNAVGVQVGEYMFEEVDDFKYLSINLSSTNDNHEEIKKRMTSGNKCFYALSIVSPSESFASELVLFTSETSFPASKSGELST